MKVVEIHWNDAWIEEGEISAKKALTLKAYKVITVGQLIAENDYGVVTITDSYPEDGDIGRVHNFVPWECITEYYVYEDI